MNEQQEKLLGSFDVTINVKDVVAIRSTCDAMLKAFSDSPQSPIQVLSSNTSSRSLRKVNFIYSVTTDMGETYVIGDDVCRNGEPVTDCVHFERIESTLSNLAIVFAMFRWAERKRGSVARLKAIERAVRLGVQV